MIPKTFPTCASLVFLTAFCGASVWAQGEPRVPVRAFSGIRPHLASFNSSAECGIGAVVPWAGRLWWVTYAPHEPDGSDDRLHSVDASWRHFRFSGSIGGTPANRMIHRESEQLFIGPYVIDGKGNVRVIPYTKMRGRPTATARHLTAPESKVYYATMEEGLYEVEVRTLEVTTLFSDTHQKQRDREAKLPGYHGKGLYSGQGVLVYANNGEYGKAALTRPDVPSGVLAEWSGLATRSDTWTVVRRNQFTDVTGPGGINGNADPQKDPLWSIGWDHRSLILMLRSAKQGAWHRYRLPKASHCYDGAHGWNTEWPRIRDIGEDDLLMTMHGSFWRFPRAFDVGRTAGTAPRSTYLKVVGDFCRFGDDVVFGCDDAAKSEFLNTRRAKGKVAGPGQSQSNLWFVPPDRLDRLGPNVGRGGPFVDETVTADTWSDPFLFAGFDRRGVHLTHGAGEPVTFSFAVDDGDGTWRPLTSVTVDAYGYAFHSFGPEAAGAWVRVALDRSCRATAWFEYRDEDLRGTQPDAKFRGLAKLGKPVIAGHVRAGTRTEGLHFVRVTHDETDVRPGALHTLRPDLGLAPRAKAGSPEALRTAGQLEVPELALVPGPYSVGYLDDDGRRWRLPYGHESYRDRWFEPRRRRVSREVVTERDLFHCAGTFYELPARNAGGFAKVRPIATHPYAIQDYCSWRGLLVLTGIDPEGPKDDPHVIRSADGEAAVWLGAVDDLWRLGKPRGFGDLWRNTAVTRGVRSDPFLMAGFDKKSVSLSHDHDIPVEFTLEVDITGDGLWRRYRAFEVPVEGLTHTFPRDFAAYWVRVVTAESCRATATFRYE